MSSKLERLIDFTFESMWMHHWLRSLLLRGLESLAIRVTDSEWCVVMILRLLAVGILEILARVIIRHVWYSLPITAWHRVLLLLTLIVRWRDVHLRVIQWCLWGTLIQCLLEELVVICSRRWSWVLYPSFQGLLPLIYSLRALQCACVEQWWFSFRHPSLSNLTIQNNN